MKTKYITPSIKIIKLHSKRMLMTVGSQNIDGNNKPIVEGDGRDASSNHRVSDMIWGEDE